MCHSPTGFGHSNDLKHSHIDDSRFGAHSMYNTSYPNIHPRDRVEAYRRNYVYVGLMREESGDKIYSTAGCYKVLYEDPLNSKSLHEMQHQLQKGNPRSLALNKQYSILDGSLASALQEVEAGEKHNAVNGAHAKGWFCTNVENWNDVRARIDKIMAKHYCSDEPVYLKVK